MEKTDKVSLKESQECEIKMRKKTYSKSAFSIPFVSVQYDVGGKKKESIALVWCESMDGWSSYK